MLLTVKVIPGAKQTKIISGPNGLLTIRLTQKPHAGQANTALIKILSRHFKISPSCISIKRGLTSKQKLVEISRL